MPAFTAYDHHPQKYEKKWNAALDLHGDQQCSIPLLERVMSFLPNMQIAIWESSAFSSTAERLEKGFLAVSIGYEFFKDY